MRPLRKTQGKEVLNPFSNVKNELSEKNDKNHKIKNNALSHEIKTTTKVEQKCNKSRTKSRTKVEQKYNKSRTKVEQEIQGLGRNCNKSRTKVEQKVEQKIEKNQQFSSLVGHQKKITKIMFLEAYKNGSLNTPPMSIDSMHQQSKIGKTSLKRTIQELEKKEILTRLSFKNGRGGWSRYQVSDKIYTQIIQLETATKVEQKVEQIGPPSSSSYLNITTTSVNKTDKNGYLDAVKIPEEIKKIGFRETQVEQISKIGKLSVEELETSLEHFSFDLGEGHIRAKTNPLNMLMGILRHGVYTSSEYLKEEETALENELRGLRERKKRRDDLLKEKQELLFEEWLEPKSKDEIVAIVPTPMNSNEFYMQGIHKELLFNHFVENEMELFKGFQQ